MCASPVGRCRPFAKRCPMYRAFGLLRTDSDFSIDEARARLGAKFPGFSVTGDANQIVVSQGEWWIALALVSGPEIQMETEGLVGHLAGVEPAEAEELATSDRRGAGRVHSRADRTRAPPGNRPVPPRARRPRELPATDARGRVARPGAQIDHRVGVRARVPHRTDRRRAGVRSGRHAGRVRAP